MNKIYLPLGTLNNIEHTNDNRTIFLLIIGNKMITIGNQGQKIVTTNFWESELADRGYCYLSLNAGAARLLVPSSVKNLVREMKTAKYVVISRGPWPQANAEDALELLFEDHSDEPFCLHMTISQIQSLPSDAWLGEPFDLTVWTKLGQKLRIRAKYRKVPQIPYLKPWTTAAVK
ncbi:hypothetical protein [Paenochrobactrum pullorum]|uniref:hypothetical protein n=1 Tax=Paenochrobactrum pullorum TaxID=1324351 RepID=UPI0035BC89E6